MNHFAQPITVLMRRGQDNLGRTCGQGAGVGDPINLHGGLNTHSPPPHEQDNFDYGAKCHKNMACTETQFGTPFGRPNVKNVPAALHTKLVEDITFGALLGTWATIHHVGRFG